jgi:peptidyl-dipeptidase A
MLLLGLVLAGCGQSTDDAADATQTGHRSVQEVPVPAQTARQFIADVNEELQIRNQEEAAANWIRVTYITPDTALIVAKAQERSLAYLSSAVKQAARYSGTGMDEQTARAIKLLKLSTAMPAPDDPDKRAELTEIATRMEGIYGAGKYCPEGPDSCLTLNDLERIMADKQHDYDALLEAWTGWRTIAPPMREDYRRFVEIANEGAVELGFDNLAELWKSGYDMTTAEFEQETERLWRQVSPLYEQLHCYVRDRLADHYGEDKVSRSGPIPAHLLGNMWAQQWGEIYDLVEPYPGISDLDIDSGLQQMAAAVEQARLDEGMDQAGADRAANTEVARQMVVMAEDFYTSLGMPELPESFWQRSMFVKPRDREVVCHASAWSMDGKEDVRIKQCIIPTGEELFTVFHELGHVYYDLLYNHLPPLFQGGAHDGFHEAVGDTVNLSMTVEYLQKLGLVDVSQLSREAEINAQMKQALDKIAFLPFGKMIDQWRWAVFDGRIEPDHYNQGWWDLRTSYQGISPPVQRSETDFDPGAKYHIPGNTPYTRYFLSFIMQFQFHKALCEAAGWQGPLHQCSVYGNAQAGDRFMATLSLGASRPWQDALEQLTGTRQMDAHAIIEYFTPLMSWLEASNQGKQCGW